MANEPYTLTNQKLYFAKLALTDWQASENTTHLNKALSKAYQERVIFHLYASLWALYNEIAAYYRFPLCSQPPILGESLSKAFVEQFPSPELNELASLLNTPSSAVASINKAWLDLFTPVTQSNEKTASQMIAKDIDTEGGLRVLQAHWQELSELIRHFRTGLTEY